MRDTLEATTNNRARPQGGLGSVAHFLSDLWTGYRAARAFRAEERTATSSLKNPETWLVDAITGGATKSGARVNENTAFNVSAVRACVDFRANLVAMLPLKLYQKTATGPVEQRDHPLAKLLRRRVSSGQTAFQWKHTCQVCFDIGGTAYSRIYRNAFAEVESIRWLKPAEVTVLINEQTGQLGYQWRGQRLQDYEILRVANLSTNGITGRSPLADLREVVGLALTTEEFTSRTFQNGNRKPGLLIPPASWKQAAADEFRTQWMKHYAGAENAGKTPLIGGGMTWQDIGFSNADAELLGLRKFSIEEIARVFHIPLHLIGSTEKATTWGSGIAELNQGLVDYTLAPICTNFESEANTTLLTEQEQDQDYFLKFNLDSLLRGSPETRAKVYQIMRGLRAITANEIRRKEELPEAPDNGANNLDWPMNNQGGGGQAPAANAIDATTGDTSP